MIGERLKYIREQKKLSGPKMAKFLDIPYNTYLNYEKDERFPDGKRILDIAKRLEVSIDYLMGNSKYPERVEDYISNKQASSGEIIITKEDLDLLGLNDKNIYQKIIESPRIIPELSRKLDNLSYKLGICRAKINQLEQLSTHKPEVNFEDDIKHLLIERDEIENNISIVSFQLHSLKEKQNLISEFFVKKLIQKEAP